MKSSLGQMASDWSSDLHETHHCGFNTSHLPLSFKLYSARCWHIASPLSTQLGCFSICYSSKPSLCRQHCVLKTEAFSTAKRELVIWLVWWVQQPRMVFSEDKQQITVAQQCLAWEYKYRLLFIFFLLPFGGQGTLRCTLSCSSIPAVIGLDTCDALFHQPFKWFWSQDFCRSPSREYRPRCIMETVVSASFSIRKDLLLRIYRPALLSVLN